MDSMLVQILRNQLCQLEMAKSNLTYSRLEKPLYWREQLHDVKARIMQTQRLLQMVETPHD